MGLDFFHKYPYSNLHELNLDWLIDETRKLIAEMQIVQETLAQIEVLTEDQIKALINSAIATNNIELYNRMLDYYNQVTNEYKSYCNSQIAQLKIYVDNQDVYYDNLAKSYADNAVVQSKAYTDSQVLNYTMMINPITGQYEDVRNVVNDIVMYFHTENSLTAGEYDALDMTAAYYDAKDISAYDYDYNAKNLLP